MLLLDIKWGFGTKKKYLNKNEWKCIMHAYTDTQIHELAYVSTNIDTYLYI